MGRSIDGFCPRGHKIAGSNVIMRNGGYKGQKYKCCRTCYNARRNASAKLRYRNDEEWRNKCKAKQAARRAKKKQQERESHEGQAATVG